MDDPTAADTPHDAPGSAAPATTSEPPTDGGAGTRRRHIGIPEALERLDRQWEDTTPFAERERVDAIQLAPAYDPRGWDFVGSLTGADDAEVADACEAWLRAQLAADALSLGQYLRPRVMLVPAGRRWHVVRAVDRTVLEIDGPGWPTPYAAAKAASRRYHAELLHELARGGLPIHLADTDDLDDIDPPEVGEAVDDSSATNAQGR